MATLDVTETTKGRRLARIGAELRKLAAVAAFFVAAACLVLFTEKLLLSGSQLAIATFTSAILAGLVMAKVMMMVDMLPAMDTGSDRPLLLTIAWKAPIYVVAVLAFRYLERLLHHLLSGESLTAASAQAVERFAQPRFWATTIWLVVLFLVFLASREMNRVLGPHRLRVMFLGR
jgi:hypothetical protein